MVFVKFVDFLGVIRTLNGMEIGSLNLLVSVMVLWATSSLSGPFSSLLFVSKLRMSNEGKASLARLYLNPLMATSNFFLVIM